MPFLIKTKGKPDPGAMGNDVLICLDGRPIARLRDWHVIGGNTIDDPAIGNILYGTPDYRTGIDRHMFHAAYNGQIPLTLEVSNYELGTVKRDFRVVSLETDELAIA